MMKGLNMYRKSQHRRCRSAFTMVEILVVVIIIAVLATMIVPKFFGRVAAAKQSMAKVNLGKVEEAIDLFNYDYDRFPEDLDELVSGPADVPEEKRNAPTIKRKNLLDPWERPFLYKNPGDHGTYDLYSLGADGQEGGEKENADIVNWDE